MDRTTVFLLLLSLAISLFPKTALAEGFCDPCTFTSLDGQLDHIGVKQTPARDSLGAVITEVIPIMSLEEGSGEFKVSPVSWSHSQYGGVTQSGVRTFDQSVSGYALAVSYTRGISERFGYSFLGAVSMGSGNTSQQTDYMARPFSSTRKDAGYLVALTVAYNRKSDTDWFKDHAMLGVDYFSESGEYSIPFVFRGDGWGPNPARAGHQGIYKHESKGSGVGIFGAIAPEIRTGPVGWGPIVYGGGTLSNTVYRTTVSDLTTGETATGVGEGMEAVFGFGLRLVYRPWDVGFTYVFPVISMGESHTKMQVVSLSKSW